MAATGISCSDDAVQAYNDFKLKRGEYIGMKYISFKVQGSTIVVDKKGSSAEFSAFTSDLPSNEPRYAVYDMDFTTTDGRPSNKVVQISWSPDTAKVKDKMVYAASKDAFLNAMVGLGTKIQATDMSELTVDIIMEACRKFA
eukprot:gene9354-19405_t